MPVAEQVVDKFSDLYKKLVDFVNNDKEINQHFVDYNQSIKGESTRNTLTHFLFAMNLENGQKVIDIFCKKYPEESNKNKELIDGFKNSFNSVFEVKKVLKDGFELYSLVNEKVYTVKVLVKMVNYRGITAGNFLSGAIVPFLSNYYLNTLNNVYSINEKLSAYREAVSLQLENPTLLYIDNDEKLKELEQNVLLLKLKFDEFFNKDEVITTNTKIDELLGVFNDFVEDGAINQNYEQYIKTPSELKYFDINGSGDPFDVSTLTNSKDCYDVGILFDPELGIQVLPFWATFKSIFEKDDYTKIPGFKNCVEHFLMSDKVSPFILRKAYELYGDVFITRIKEIIDIKEDFSIESLIHLYKKPFELQKNFSSTTVLYSSDAFTSLMELSVIDSENQNKSVIKAGRNEACPCGSGKKYKKCCLQK